MHFAFTVLETSRDNLLKDRQEADLVEAFQFNFDSELTFEQFDIIRQELRDVAAHVMQLKKENKTQQAESFTEFPNDDFLSHHYRK